MLIIIKANKLFFMNFDRHFSKKTVKALNKKGISIVGIQAAKAFEEDSLFSDTVYQLSFNGTGFIRTHSQVVVIASSSWNPATDLDVTYNPTKPVED